MADKNKWLEAKVDEMLQYPPDRWVFAFDVDDTLTDRDSGEMPESAVQAIKDLQMLGCRCLIDTGNSEIETHNKGMFGKGIVWDGLVAVNGQVVINEYGDTITDKRMNEIDSEKVAKVASEHNLAVLASTSKGFVLINADGVDKDSPSWEAAKHIPNLRYSTDTIYELQEQGVDVYNYSVIGKWEDLNNQVRAEFDLNEKGEDHYGLLTSHTYYFDVVDASTSKFSGIVDYVAKEMDIQDMNQVYTVCFGDAPNDHPMLERADFSVCMGNGNDITKEVADYVTGSVLENGLQQVVETIKDKYKEIEIDRLSQGNEKLESLYRDIAANSKWEEFVNFDQNVSAYSQEMIMSLHERCVDNNNKADSSLFKDLICDENRELFNTAINFKDNITRDDFNAAKESLNSQEVWMDKDLRDYFTKQSEHIELNEKENIVSFTVKSGSVYEIPIPDDWYAKAEVMDIIQDNNVVKTMNEQERLFDGPERN